MTIVRNTLAAALAAASLGAHALDVPADGNWTEFDFGAAGSAWFDLGGGDTAFTFTLAQAGRLRVVDLYLAGDRFQVFANGMSLGTTSTVVIDDSLGEFDPEAAWADGRYSRGEWLLAAGSYTLTGIAAASPFDAGVGAFSVTPVPEPETYAMMLAGLGVLGALRRRRA